MNSVMSQNYKKKMDWQIILFAIRATA